MTASEHQTYVYVGLGGEGDNLAQGGMMRMNGGDWQSIANGLPENPQVRALAIHPNSPSTVYAGTQSGVYRSDDRGENWEALESPRPGMDVWSLAFHPNQPNVLFAGYEPCAIYRSEDGQRAHLWVFRQAVGYALPLVVSVRPAHQAAFTDVVPFTREADVDVGLMVCVCHVVPPKFSFLTQFRSARSLRMCNTTL